jgi:hypothetical protein
MKEQAIIEVDEVDSSMSESCVQDNKKLNTLLNSKAIMEGS